MRRVQFHLRSASQWNHPLQTSLNCRRSCCKDLHAQAEDFLRRGCLQAAFQLGNALGFEYLWGIGVFAWPVTSHHPPRPQAVEHVSHKEFGGRLSGLDDSIWFRWFMYALRVAIPCLGRGIGWNWSLGGCGWAGTCRMHAYTCVTTTPGFQRSHADKAAVHKCERPPSF